MVCLDTIRPHVTRDFLREFRALGKQVGYRNLGRAIAYMDTTALMPTSATPTVSRNGQRRNGRKGKHQWFCRGSGRKHTCVCYTVCQTCLKEPEHRFTHNVKGIFAYSFLVQRGNGAASVSGHTLQEIAACLMDNPKIAFGRWTHETEVKCCGEPMGVMPDSLDPSRWRYQCAVDPKHSRDVRIAIGCGPSGQEGGGGDG